MKKRQMIRVIERYRDQLTWMLECGGDLKGYREKYSEKDGDGADAIYQADLAELRRRREQLPAAMR
jgi:hypothetical protein